MELIVNKHIGKNVYRFSFEGKDLFDLVMKSQHLSFQDVYKCGFTDCESDKLYLRAYITKEDAYEYVKILCSSCGGSVTFGKTKKDGTFFLRRNEEGSIQWEPGKAKEEKV